MAKEVSTNDAFEHLVNSPYYWSLTGLSKEVARYYRSVLKTGNKPISTDKKEELLEKAGFTVKQEKTWNLPT